MKNRAMNIIEQQGQTVHEREAIVGYKEKTKERGNGRMQNKEVTP